MSKLMKFLIYSMNTIDGERGSSLAYQTFIVEKLLKKNKLKNKLEDISEKEIAVKVRH